MSSINPKHLAKQQRQFFIIVALALVGFGVWKLFKNRTTPAAILISLGFVFLGLEFLLTSVASRLFGYWMAFAKVLAVINTTILLTLIYFLLLTPIALIKRAFSQNPEKTYREKKSSWEMISEQTQAASRYWQPY